MYRYREFLKILHHALPVGTTAYSTVDVWRIVNGVADTPFSRSTVTKYLENMVTEGLITRQSQTAINRRLYVFGA